MATTDNYIGVAMGLDVTDLKAGLSEANKQIQLANSEFKATASSMDDWTKSTDGLNAKVKQLDTVLTAQRSKLNGLQAEYDKVAKSQGENSDQARKLQVQINNQLSVVNRTEKELDNYKETLKGVKDGSIDLETATLKAGKAVSKMGDETKDAGGKLDGLKGVAGGVMGAIAGLGAVVAGAVTGFFSLAESTRETRKILGQLETAFTTAGLSAEDATHTYETLYGVLGDEGKANEASLHIASLAHSQEDLSKWTDIATGVYATFGDSLPIESLAEASNETAKTGKITGALADAINWAGANEEDFQKKLDACNTEQERQALITDMLSGKYSEASEKYKEVNKDLIEAQEATARYSNAMAELGAIAEPIMTTLKNLMTDFIQTIKPFVSLIGEGLTSAFSGSADGASKLAEGIGGILNALVERLTNMLPTVLNIILQLVPQIVESLLNSLPQILTLILDLIVKIIDMLGTLLPQIVQKVIEIVPLLIEALVNAIPQLLDSAINFFMAIIEAIPVIITALLKELPNIIKTVIDALLKAIPQIIDGAIKMFMAIIDALPVIIQELVKALPKIINTVIDGLLNAIPLLLDGAVKMFMAIIQALPTIITLLVKELPKIVTTIVNTLLSRIGDIINGAIQLFMGIIKAIPQIVVELIRNIPQIITAIVKGLASGLSEIKNAGLNIVKGIWDGIKSGATWLKNKITGFAGDVAGWFKKTFKIKSPSRLMADEVGLFIGEGIGQGVINSIPAVKKDLGKFSNFVTNNLGNIKSGLAVDGLGNTYTGNGIARGNTVVNAGMTVNYNGTLSRKELYKIENDNRKSIFKYLKTEGGLA